MYKKSFLTILGLSSVLTAANNHDCGPVCYPDDCTPCQRCLGPENFAGNPPVCPAGCNGDVEITVAAFYWNCHQDGMEYAIVNHVQNPLFDNSNVANIELNQLVDAEYKHPKSKWDWGFKVGIGYCSPCDGWNLNLLWTRYDGRSSDQLNYSLSNNATILPLWSNFATQYANADVPVAFANGDNLIATNVASNWKLKLNLVDLELGRGFWVSRYLNIRPFVGVRYGSINQSNDIDYNGGSWQQTIINQNTTPIYSQPALNGLVMLSNHYRGAGLRAGLGSEWNFGCGWAIYGNFAASILYGKFNLHHKEKIRMATTSPHNEATILEADESLRASRAILDMALGIQWSTMFCSCKYGFTAMLGWEQHTFFDQNQLFRVNRVGVSAVENTLNTGLNALVPNVTGDNIIEHRRGSLDTQGWTLTFKFDF